MRIIVTWQLRVTLDSIRNYCNVYILKTNKYTQEWQMWSKCCHLEQGWRAGVVSELLHKFERFLRFLAKICSHNLPPDDWFAHCHLFDPFHRNWHRLLLSLLLIKHSLQCKLFLILSMMESFCEIQNTLGRRSIKRGESMVFFTVFFYAFPF